jgi:hypothetical protein
MRNDNIQIEKITHGATVEKNVWRVTVREVSRLISGSHEHARQIGELMARGLAGMNGR